MAEANQHKIEVGESTRETIAVELPADELGDALGVWRMLVQAHDVAILSEQVLCHVAMAAADVQYPSARSHRFDRHAM